MQISDLNIANWVQQLGSGALGVSSGAGSSGLFAATTAGQNATGATPKSPASPGGQFAPQTLAALLSAQSDSFANRAAGGIINALNPGGSSLSLAQVESAVSGAGASSGAVSASSATPTKAQITQAFAQLDTDGDGQLSQGELATGLQSLGQRAQQAGLRHHHHHHQPASEASAPTAA